MREFQLPQAAQSRLNELRMQTMSAEDGGRALVNRISMLPQENADGLRERLNTERQRLQHRHGQLHQLVNRVQQYLVELPHTTSLVEHGSTPVELEPGTTLDQALNDTRTRIAAAKQHLQAVRLAPLPKEDQKQAALDYARGLIRNGRPTISFADDQLKVSLRGEVFAVEDQLALIAWAAPAELLETLEREIDQMPVRADAMPRSERLKRVGELETQLLEFEQYEESLIMRAASDGLEILRRVDADPRAVLGVTIKAQQQQVA